MAEYIQTYKIQNSSLETIDEAVYNWIKNKNLEVETAQGFVNVPIFWQSAERSFQVKNTDGLRDENNAIIMPIIYINNVSHKKNPQFRTAYYANLYPQPDEKGGTVTYTKVIQQDKTSNFKQADIHRLGPNFVRRKNKKTVYQVISAPIPISLESMYKITIKTDKYQHINTIKSSIIKDGYNNEVFIIKSNNDNRYEAWLSDYPTKVDDFFDEKERIFEMNLDLKVLGYIYTAEKNEPQPEATIRENIVDIKIPRERSSLSEVNILTKKSKFRD